jgi:site-specific DNA-methyltransferase (adenine-specific)
LCDEIRERVPAKEAKTGKVDNRTRLVPNLLVGYFNDMEEVFVEMAKYTSTDSPCYVVVDQSSYLGAIVPTDLLLANIAKRHDFEVSQLMYCGKANTSAQQLIQYPYLGEMLRTTILSLKRS